MRRGGSLEVPPPPNETGWRRNFANFFGEGGFPSRWITAQSLLNLCKAIIRAKAGISTSHFCMYTRPTKTVGRTRRQPAAGRR